MIQKKTIEDYLKVIYGLKKRSGRAWGVDIAEALEVTRPTVSTALKELEKEGYLFADGAHEIHLTEKGLKIAEDTYERHQTLLKLLIALGVEQKTAAKDACLLEHAVSPESYRALKSLASKQTKRTETI